MFLSKLNKPKEVLFASSLQFLPSMKGMYMEGKKKDSDLAQTQLQHIGRGRVKFAEGGGRQTGSARRPIERVGTGIGK